MEKIKLDNELLGYINVNMDKLKSKTTTISESKNDHSDHSDRYDIHPEDSLPTSIVKSIITEKKINIKSLEFNDTRELNNYKRTLNHHRTMSINKFERWMYLLDEDWCLLYGDELKQWKEFKRLKAKEKLEEQE